MKKTVSTLLVAISAFGVLAFAASSAEAQHRGHHGHHGFHGARVGVFIGAPLAFAAWPYYRPYPYYDPYYARPIVIQEQPVIYTEQAQAVPQSGPMAPPPAPQAQAQQQYWYFCQDTQTYYPHVQNCATPWQRVIPQAPR